MPCVRALTIRTQAGTLALAETQTCCTSSFPLCICWMVGVSGLGVVSQVCSVDCSPTDAHKAVSGATDRCIKVGLPMAEL